VHFKCTMFHSHLNTDFISLFCVILNLKKEGERHEIDLGTFVHIMKYNFNLVPIQKFNIFMGCY